MTTPSTSKRNLTALGATVAVIAASFGFVLLMATFSENSSFVGSANAQPGMLANDPSSFPTSSDKNIDLIAFNQTDSDEDVKERQEELDMVITPFKQDGFSGTVFEFTPQSNKNMRCVVFNFGNVGMSCMPKSP
jgi:hypothetical protein